MKNLFVTLLSALFLLPQSMAQGIAEKQIADKIYNCFEATLNFEEMSDIPDAPLAADEIPEVRELVWDTWKKAVNGYDEEKLIELSILENRNSGSWKLPEWLEPDATMPYYYGCNEYPSFDDGKRYPLFVYMHGSGDKVSEWETGIGFCLRRFYSPAIYFVPQIPNAYGEYYRWAIQSKQWAWEKLLRLAFVSENVDPNKIYFFGISEGGYGSQRLASFYADYLAGAGPMAGGEPLKNAPMENVANIAFSLRTGALDDGFGRNILTQKALEVADGLQAVHPGYYNHYIEVIEGYGHGINYRPTTPWLAQYSRDPRPDYFYWENYDMYGRNRNGFYNLRVMENAVTGNGQRACYEVAKDGNTISLNVKALNYTTTYSQSGIEMFFSKDYSTVSKGLVRIYLHEEEYDLDQPVKIILNGKEIFNATVSPSLKTMIESCAFYYDPERLFPAAIDIDIATGSATDTGIDELYIDKREKRLIYDTSGRIVDKPVSGGVYIIDGTKQRIRL